MRKMKILKTASKGIAIAKAYIYEEDCIVVNENIIRDDEKETEFQKFKAAKKKVMSDLSELADQEEIFAAHLALADDFTFEEGVESKIKHNYFNVQFAVQKTIDEIVSLFVGMTDEYMAERASDIKDIGKRFIHHLDGSGEKDFSDIKEEVILVARDLYPSDTVKLDFNFIKGLITEEGAITSHVSIMAKGSGIPALVGVEDLLAQVKEGDLICMDAKEGSIVINPDEETLKEYQNRLTEYEKQEQLLLELSELQAETLDGRTVKLCANAGNISEVQNAVKNNAEGIGLFRSEFLYMENTHFPNEEEQFNAYKMAVEACPTELTVRTLDIGGDKSLPYYEFEKEDNPFLGWRAIRISLEMVDMFKVQLKAILRASSYGHMRIMFPMIISLEELKRSKEVLALCMEELKAANVAFDPDIEIGMMMETPSSVLLADRFAEEVDFFSIGTNDLTQYLLAVDRGNKKIAELYNSFHPAVLKAIKTIIDAGHKQNIRVGMCGEFAGNEQAIKLLIGMKLDEFSVSPGNIAEVKYLIRSITYEESQALTDRVLKCYTLKEVLDELDRKEEKRKL